MILDGRGSARLSHLGAAAALCALRAAIRRWEGELAALLDTPNHHLAAIGWQGLAQLLYYVAASEQLKLGAWHETQTENFEFTLTLAIVGRASIGWLSVGDSPLVVSRHGIMGLAAPLEEASFANQTTFVAASPQVRLGLRGGVLPSAGVDAVLAMSDGTASRLLHLKQQIPADAVADIAKGLASDAWTEAWLREMLKEPGWDSVTRDDRSIALLALHSGTSMVAERPGSEHVIQATIADRQPPPESRIIKSRLFKAAIAACLLIGALMVISMTGQWPTASLGGGMMSEGVKLIPAQATRHEPSIHADPINLDPDSESPSPPHPLTYDFQSPMPVDPPCSTPPLSSSPEGPDSPPPPQSNLPCEPKAAQDPMQSGSDHTTHFATVPLPSEIPGHPII